MDNKNLPKPDKAYLNVKQKGKQDQVFPDFPENKNKGSKELIEKYNVNDQAHANSSEDDFVKTVSNFKHSEEK